MRFQIVSQLFDFNLNLCWPPFSYWNFYVALLPLALDNLGDTLDILEFMLWEVRKKLASIILDNFIVMAVNLLAD